MINHNKVDNENFRQERVDLSIRILDRYADIANMDSSHERLNYFQSLGEDGFVNGITAIHRILAKNHVDTFKTNYLAERPNAIVLDDEPDLFQAMPAPDDKDTLLRELYRYTSFIASKEDASIEHVAAVVGYGINAIHPFMDVNGRTARTAHGLMVVDPDDRETMLRAISFDTDDNAVALNPSIFRDPLYSQMKISLQTHYERGGQLHPYIRLAVPRGFAFDEVQPKYRKYNLEDADIMAGSVCDRHLAEMMPYYMARDHASEAVHKSIQHINGHAAFRIDIFAQEATPSDIKNFKLAYRTLTNTYVIQLLDMIADPNDIGHLITTETKERGSVTLKATELVTLLAQKKLTLLND